MQAGAAYVCVDPTFPDAHLAHVAADAKAVAVLAGPLGLGSDVLPANVRASRRT
jgi:non-ribosomal peptide synthetase component F